MTACPMIAAVVLTYNEELNISECLASLRWADEVLVLDSGSTDRTCDIAVSSGATVMRHVLEPFHFAMQRNYALFECGITAEWVLFVDADERIPPQLAETIRDVIAHAAPETAAYRLAPRFMFMGKWLKHCCRFPVWHDRLVRREKVSFVGVGPPDVINVEDAHWLYP